MNGIAVLAVGQVHSAPAAIIGIVVGVIAVILSQIQRRGR